MKSYPTAVNVAQWKDAIGPRMAECKTPDEAIAHVMQSLPFQSYEISQNVAQQIAGELVKKRFPEYEVGELQRKTPGRQQIRLTNMGFKV